MMGCTTLVIGQHVLWLRLVIIQQIALMVIEDAEQCMNVYMANIPPIRDGPRVSQCLLAGLLPIVCAPLMHARTKQFVQIQHIRIVERLYAHWYRLVTTAAAVSLATRHAPQLYLVEPEPIPTQGHPSAEHVQLGRALMPGQHLVTLYLVRSGMDSKTAAIQCAHCAPLVHGIHGSTSWHHVLFSTH